MQHCERYGIRMTTSSTTTICCVCVFASIASQLLTELLTSEYSESFHTVTLASAYKCLAIAALVAAFFRYVCIILFLSLFCSVRFFLFWFVILETFFGLSSTVCLLRERKSKLVWVCVINILSFKAVTVGQCKSTAYRLEERCDFSKRFAGCICQRSEYRHI